MAKEIRASRVDVMHRRSQDEAFDNFVGRKFASKGMLRRLRRVVRVVTSGVHGCARIKGRKGKVG
jgi:hypothetical protein